MPALFSRRSNSVFGAWLSVLGGLVVILPSALLLAPWTPYVTGQGELGEQPVLFDHRHHVSDDGIDCRYCHDLVERSPYAGVPPTERCLNCHNQVWNRSPLLRAVWESRASGRPIPWQRVHRLPAFVYFDHSAHVNGGVGCVTCHGAIERMPRVVQASPLTMRWCLDCHRSPQSKLRPRAWITSSVAELPDSVRADVPAVSPGTNCSTCHR